MFTKRQNPFDVVHLPGYVTKPLATFDSDRGQVFHIVRMDPDKVSVVLDGFPCKTLLWWPEDLIKAMGGSL